MSLRHALLVAATLAISACSSGSIEIFEQCSVAVNLDTSSAQVGDTVTAEGGPFGESWDNAVEFDGSMATVVSVNQAELLNAAGEPFEADACNRCNTCRDNNPGHCNRCRSVCGACTETLTFLVPDVAPGSRSLVLRNRWGSSDRMTFDVQDTETGSSTGGTGTPSTTGGTGTPTSTGGTGGMTATGGTGTATATGGTGTSTGGTGVSTPTGDTGTVTATGGTGSLSPTGGTGVGVSGTGGTGP